MAKQSLVAFAESKIREMIISGELLQGQKLTEEKLAEQFSISTTPVHEALKILASIGLVIVKPRSGTYVAGFTLQDVENLNSVRFIIECEAIRESMERNYKALCDDLAYNILQSKEALKRKSIKDYIFLDNEFHSKFFANADNNFLDMSFSAIQPRVTMLYNYKIKEYTIEDFEVSLRQHQDLLQAIRNKNFEMAKDKLKEHTIRIRRYYHS